VNDGDRIFIGLLCAGAVCVLVILIDGWVLRPRRDPGASSADEPMLPKLAGYALVGLALGMLWRLFKYEAVDFSLMLVVVGAVSGIIWAADQLIFARRRNLAAASAGTIGGMRCTRRCKCGISNFGAEILSRAVLVCGRPQQRMNAVRIPHGIHA